MKVLITLDSDEVILNACKAIKNSGDEANKAMESIKECFRGTEE